jgi:hypothetical protein
MAYVGPIDGEWMIELVNRGVDPRELESRWEAIELLYAAYDELTEAADRLRGNLAIGIEAWEDYPREDVAVGRARFEQALAEFRHRGLEAQSWAVAA